jgi:hypothetical protein
MPREVIRGGVRGHIVHVEANERFVPHKYPGKDPRTIAKRRGRL